MKRCNWCKDDPLYVKYHDEEWGVPVHDDRTLFEFLLLEGAQAGLSWITILRKREGYKKAYDDFDFQKVADYDEEKIDELLLNPGIVRNKLKVRSSINNARLFMDIQKEFGSFDSYIWGFTDNLQVENNWDDVSQMPATSELSDKVSKDLKKRGFKFTGSTIMYSYLQAVGIINDHMVWCGFR
ncbi:DNA-3-methyladenine glycosylase I [Proteocatella sphenisci]|uniref:DNA-3-methyladenine glycosylase I n=1 Tax=Proteocatella sphenisci TaxID=181070 RepID=UPI00048D1E60|nr:DNA-3-methyladenine glycosylase I [Proteocatella sphenisci]